MGSIPSSGPDRTVDLWAMPDEGLPILAWALGGLGVKPTCVRGVREI